MMIMSFRYSYIVREPRTVHAVFVCSLQVPGTRVLQVLLWCIPSKTTYRHNLLGEQAKLLTLASRPAMQETVLRLST